MNTWILVIASCITATSAVPEQLGKDEISGCGNSGCGTRHCANHPGYTCTNCGCDPCVDVHNNCWSCATADGHCFPYDCGTHCSTGPCMERKDFFEKHNGNGTVFSAFPGIESLAPTQNAKEDPAV